jgi:hypothetical protein
MPNVEAPLEASTMFAAIGLKDTQSLLALVFQRAPTFDRTTVFWCHLAYTVSEMASGEMTR